MPRAVSDETGIGPSDSNKSPVSRNVASFTSLRSRMNTPGSFAAGGTTSITDGSTATLPARRTNGRRIGIPLETTGRNFTLDRFSRHQLSHVDDLARDRAGSH